MSDFIEENYIKKLIDDNYKVVDSIILPDGIYHKYGDGYQFAIHGGLEDSTFGVQQIENPKNYTGYCIITNSGIKGSWDGESIEIKNGDVIFDDVYKIMTNRYDIIREEKLEELLK